MPTSPATARSAPTSRSSSSPTPPTTSSGPTGSSSPGASPSSSTGRSAERGGRACTGNSRPGSTPSSTPGRPGRPGAAEGEPDDVLHVVRGRARPPAEVVGEQADGGVGDERGVEVGGGRPERG